MSRLKVWLLASRPATLTAVVSPLLVGGALANMPPRREHVLPWLAAFFGALFIQLGTNYANDVFDFEKGADTVERVGPMRAVQAGLVTSRQMRRAMILAFTLATLCGTYLVWLCGWPLVWIGVASILSGIAYTGGPFPLGYNGLGDIFVFIFFGIVATAGTFFVQACGSQGNEFADVPLLVWLYSIPIGFTCTAILVVNNLRDMDTDAKVGKKTLAVRFGEKNAREEYTLLLVLALLWPIGLLWFERVFLLGGTPFRRLLVLVPLLLPLTLIPSAWKLIRTIWRTRDPGVLNPLLGATARFHLAYGVLTAVALLLQFVGYQL